MGYLKKMECFGYFLKLFKLCELWEWRSFNFVIEEFEKTKLEKSSNRMSTKIDLRNALAPLTQSMGAINRTFFFVTNQSRLKVPCCASNLWVAKVNHFLPWFFSLKATHINFDTLINRFLNLTTIWRIYYKIGKKVLSILSKYFKNLNINLVGKFSETCE